MNDKATKTCTAFLLCFALAALAGSNSHSFFVRYDSPATDSERGMDALAREVESAARDVIDTRIELVPFDQGARTQQSLTTCPLVLAEEMLCRSQ